LRERRPLGKVYLGRHLDFARPLVGGKREEGEEELSYSVTEEALQVYKLTASFGITRAKREKDKSTRVVYHEEDIG